MCVCVFSARGSPLLFMPEDSLCGGEQGGGRADAGCPPPPPPLTTSSSVDERSEQPRTTPNREPAATAAPPVDERSGGDADAGYALVVINTPGIHWAILAFAVIGTAWFILTLVVVECGRRCGVRSNEARLPWCGIGAASRSPGWCRHIGGQ